ncbi:MAG: hypothetical protein SFU86_08105 [Pirellulaceae bacterium]|nr:hypothetical protein [Pirellulaceae bacterium]
MLKLIPAALPAVLKIAAVLLILKVTLSVVAGYRDYLPPNFDADFLLGRERYFWGAYSAAFYVHLLAGPTALVVGTILIRDRFGQASPRH